MTWHDKAEHTRWFRCAGVLPRMLRTALDEDIALFEQACLPAIELTYDCEHSVS